MIKNYVSILILSFICAVSINTLDAQDKKVTTKVIVIEKSVDKDGNVTEKKVIKEGEDADAIIEEMDIDIDFSDGEGEDKNVYRISKKKNFKVKTINENGEEEVIEWNGEGEMPEKMREMMEKEGINIDNEDENIWVIDEGTKIVLNSGENKVIKKEAYKMKFIDDEGNEELIEWNGEGEMPEAIKKMKEEEEMDGDHKVIKIDASESKSKIKIKKSKDGTEEDIEIEFEGDDIPEDVKKILEENNIDIFIKNDKEEVNSKKAQLGVMIEEAANGVRIRDIMENTAAADAGLTKGQIITAVDGIAVKTAKELVNLISAFKPGDVVNLTIDDQGTSSKVKVTLKEQIDNFPIKSWNTFMTDEDEEEIEIIIKKKK